MLLSQLYVSLTAVPHSVPLPLADQWHITAAQKLMLYYLFYAGLSKSLSVS